MPSKLGRAYGWKKDKVAPYRMLYKNVFPVTVLPLNVDMRNLCPPIVDQLSLGSCTANAGAGIMGILMNIQKLTLIALSRLYIYYNTRAIEGTTGEDSGASVTDTITSIQNTGGCPESEWVYDVTQFAVKPTPQCYVDGLKIRATLDARVPSNDLGLIDLCLANGTPIIFGFNVYDSFESQAVANTGIMPMPAVDSNGVITEMLLGGHCVVMVGYTIINGVGYYICRNSWGTGWGDKGYFYMPRTFVQNANFTDDFWTIKLITEDGTAQEKPLGFWQKLNKWLGNN